MYMKEKKASQDYSKSTVKQTTVMILYGESNVKISDSTLVFIETQHISKLSETTNKAQ